MTIILILPFVFLFTVGAKASIENERGQIDWLLQMGIPKAVIVVLFFVFAPWVVWNGCVWCVWWVKIWLQKQMVKRRVKQAFRRIARNHKDDPELQASIKEFIDTVNRL